MDSDEEFEFEDEDDDAMGWQGEERRSDGEADEAILIENAFFEAEDIIPTNPAEALRQFENVAAMHKKQQISGASSAKSAQENWTFKCLQHIVCLHARLKNSKQMAEAYKELLAMTNRVTRNEAQNMVDAVLEAANTLAADSEEGGTEELEQVYKLTLEKLKENPSSERLWLSTSLKLAKLHLARGEEQKLSEMLPQLQQACRNPNTGEDDLSKGGQLLETYALEMQYNTLVGNTQRIREIYPRVLKLGSSIVDVRTLAIVRESGGKMLLSEEKWGDAYNELYEAFRCYQESGNMKAKACLVWLVIASLLSGSDINPFDSREAKVLEEDGLVTAAKKLRVAYDADDVSTISELLEHPSSPLSQDAIVQAHRDALLEKVRKKALKYFLTAYSSVRLSTLAKDLGTDIDRVTLHLMQLITIDREVKGRIDGQRDIFISAAEVHATAHENMRRVKDAALDDWESCLDTLRGHLTSLAT